MTTSRVPSVLRKQGDPEPPTFLELFFDLVYIFTFRRLAHQLDQSFTAVGMLRVAVLLLATWWIWELMVWLTDLFDPRQPYIQFLIILAMFGSLVMALVVPSAFGGSGWIFVVAYLGIIFTRAAVLITLTRGSPVQARSVRLAFWFGVTGFAWFAGAFVPDATVRLVLWAIAVTTDYTAASIGWITPRLGRTSLESRIFTGVHVSERHRQIFIIALGEVILSNGLKFTSTRFESGQWATLVTAFMAVVLLFLIYARQSRRLLAPPALWSMDRVGPGIVTAYAHLIMVAGVVALSASDAFVALRPVGDLSTVEALAVVAGPALVLFGTFLFERAVSGQILWSRPIAIVVLLGVAPWIDPQPALVPAIGADVVLAGVFASDIVFRQRWTRSRAGSLT
ncbi:low temperature requirement protein A [Rugosimonospora africana]|uniref:Membrane protein n=1 Tax=Rugosimonospora africana TaxID=556532 RepID=A0A8J3QR14_9ACTN|nr:low temperature requirement protein A [Rugosimonospora africana]GIH14747.1 membrane protein [Rugosimonospora africana]